MEAYFTIVISYLGALMVAVTSPSRLREIRWTALITTILGLAIAICCATRRVATDGGFQDVVQYDWIPSIGTSFHLGVDGISLPMILVTGIVAVCGVLMSWRVESRCHEYVVHGDRRHTCL